MTIPLVAPADLERAGAPLDRLVEAANPLRAEESVLRTRILPGLLRAVAHNHAHGLTEVGLALCLIAILIFEPRGITRGREFRARFARRRSVELEVRVDAVTGPGP